MTKITHEYRSDAKKALTRAKAELGSGEDQRLRYAALELRTAMECLAYDRILLYRSELPSSSLEIWQPKQVMDVLLELDETADKSSLLRVAPESEPGVRSGPFESVGQETVLSMKEIKDYYARLGSYLHPPTIKQIESGKVTPPDKIRERCQEVATLLEKVLKSKIWNINFKFASTMPCMKCQHPIVRRLPSNGANVDATCPNCGAMYVLYQKGGGKVDWEAQKTDLPCLGCGEKAHVWRHEIRIGAHWICASCKGWNNIVLGIDFDPTVEGSEANKASPEQ